MLLLRVFAEEPLRNRLMDVLDDSWRRIGCIDLIVGTDLAIRSLSPMALKAFLLGRVDRQVLTTVQDAHNVWPSCHWNGRSMADISSRVSLFARPVAARRQDAGGRADVVLVDLGGWNPSHRGATFELSLVMDQCPSPVSCCCPTGRRTSRD